MSFIQPTSRPQLAPGCRLSDSPENESSLMVPEGILKLTGPGRAIVVLCDGQRTFQEIVTSLASQYGAADPQKITEDASKFLEALQRKRIVDY